MPAPSVRTETRTNRKCITDFAGIVDFSLGAWTARAAARQLAGQLRLELAPVETADADDGNIIARGVDKEAAGPQRIMTAYADARQIAAALGSRSEVLVLPPAHPSCQEYDRDPFLAFLTRLGIRVKYSAELSLPPAPDATGLPRAARALLAFYPGLLPPGLIAAAGLGQWPDLFADPQRGLVHPALRDVDLSRSASRIAALAPYVGDDAQVAILYHMFGPAFYADRATLIELGCGLCRQGEFYRGKRLLQRARAISPSAAERAVCDLHMQGFRIFEHRFAEAAGMPVPPADLPADLRDKLLLTIGWGLIFKAQAKEGLALLAPSVAKALERPQASTDDLFLLNIAALGHLRSGDPGRAYELEKEIESRVLAENEPDQRALFINSLNLARLCRGRGDPESYTRYLDRAFATTDGLRHLSEMLQLNLMRGRYGDGARHADMYTLRAALIWLCLDPPQSLSIRAQQTLTFSAVPFDRFDAEMSALLADELSAQWPDAAPQDGPAVFHVAGVHSCDLPAGARAFGQEHLCLFAAPDAPNALCGPPERHHLIRLVTGILRQVFPKLPATAPCSVLLNFDVGQDIPRGRHGLLTMMARCGVQDGCWDGEDVKAPASGALAVRLADGVGSVEADTVVFRRSRPPCSLTADQAGLVQAMASGQTPLDILAQTGGRDTGAVLTICRELERNHVVKFEVQNA